MKRTYLFTSARLGFREWEAGDIDKLAAINADADVMEFFPSVKTWEETAEFIDRMQKQMSSKGYCYYAVDALENGDFIGFIGLCDQTYEASFTPCVDIGWRLAKHAWGNGYATEGAKRCLEYGLNELGLARIVAVAPTANVRSEQVMKNAGMQKVAEFIHPLLVNDERLRDCVLYEIIPTTL